MRTYIYYIILATLLCCSCVDEFDANLSKSDTMILCVEGTIQSNTDCFFYLSHSISINPDDEELFGGISIYDAEIAVHGSNGEVWKGDNIYGTSFDNYGYESYANYGLSGTYLIRVGQLDPSCKYWLEVIWNDNTYKSTPQEPLPTPEIEDLSWEMAVDGQNVNFMVTTAPSSTEKQYYRWNYEEFWEVHTPLTAFYEYVPETDEIVPVETRLNIGWAQHYNPSYVNGNNENYQSGQIRNFVIYDVDKDDNRFNYRYYTRVHQTAISREEFEYDRLSAQLSDEMGGLFTPQPSALPSNIHCQTADVQAIGYVGVSLNSTSAHIYVNRKDVGHVDQRRVEIADEETITKTPWKELWQRGWRVYEYRPEFDPPASWTSRWCVDCTAPYWGASLNRPSFWED